MSLFIVPLQSLYTTWLTFENLPLELQPQSQSILDVGAFCGVYIARP